jgi:hypothetical protein
MPKKQPATNTEDVSRQVIQAKPDVRVVFCIPGSSFSGKFLECWTNLVAWCLKNNIQPILSCRQPNLIFPGQISKEYDI